MCRFPAGVRHGAVVVAALVIGACQTGGTSSSGGPSVAELRKVPPLEGERRPGVLPRDVQPRPFPAQTGIRIFAAYEDDAVVGRYVIHGKSTYSIADNGDVSRTDHFETATVAVRSKARNGRAGTANFVIDPIPLREEVREPAGTLKSLRRYELQSADVMVRDGPASLIESVIGVLNDYYRDGALVYPANLSKETFIGDASLIPNDADSAITVVETILIPAVERGNASGDQDSYLRHLRNQVAEVKRNKQDYDFKSDVRVRGTWVLDGREYLELNGPYRFAGSVFGSGAGAISGNQTVLIDPSTGTYRVFLGSLEEPGGPGGKGSNLKFRIRIDLMLPLDAATANQSPDTQPQPATVSAKSLTLALSREGRGDLLIGRLSFDAGGEAGKFNAAVGAVRCEGTWQYFDEANASWSMTCTDGVAAAGNFRRTGPDTGSGRGVATDGKAVRLTFGED